MSRRSLTVKHAGFTPVEFIPSSALGQEVVSFLQPGPSKDHGEIAVSIERVSAAICRNAPAANFYDVGLAMKGVDVTTSSSKNNFLNTYNTWFT